MMTGQFYKTVSGRESYEIYEATDEFIYEVIKVLKDNFGFETLIPTFGNEEICVTCQRENCKLLVGWDNWSGCFVMASNEHGDSMVREIGDYFNSILNYPEL